MGQIQGIQKKVSKLILGFILFVLVFTGVPFSGTGLSQVETVRATPDTTNAAYSAGFRAALMAALSGKNKDQVFDIAKQTMIKNGGTDSLSGDLGYSAGCASSAAMTFVQGVNEAKKQGSNYALPTAAGLAGRNALENSTGGYSEAERNLLFNTYVQYATKVKDAEDAARTAAKASGRTDAEADAAATAAGQTAGQAAGVEAVEATTSNSDRYTKEEISNSSAQLQEYFKFAKINGTYENNVRLSYGNNTYQPCGKLGFIGNIVNIPYQACNATVFMHDIFLNLLVNGVVLMIDTTDILSKPKSWVKPHEMYANGIESVSSSIGRGFMGFDKGMFEVPIQDDLVGTTGVGVVVRNAEKAVRAILTFIVIVGFIALAIMNILQIQMNSYSMKKVLPGLMIGYLVSFCSFFAIRASLEIVSVIGSSITQIGAPDANSNRGGYFFLDTLSNFPLSLRKIGDPCSFSSSYMTVKGNNDTTDPQVKDGTILCSDSNSVDYGKITMLLFKTVAMAAGGIMIIILTFLLFIRRLIFYFLIPLAPLAIMGMFFQPLSSIWQRWWKTFSGWLFMPVVCSFWIWLAMVWFNAFPPSTYDLGTAGQNGALSQPIFSFAFGMVCLYLAMKTPFSMAGEASAVLNKWSSMGKKAWGATGGAALKSAGKAAGGAAKEAWLRATPAGMIVRASKKFNENTEKRRAQLTSGDIVKNKTLREHGGDSINRFAERKALHTEENIATQQSYSNLVKAGAEKQVREGLLASSGREDLVNIAKGVENITKKRAFNNANKYGDVMEREEEAKRISAETKKKANSKYLTGNNDPEVARRRLEKKITAEQQEEAMAKETTKQMNIAKVQIIRELSSKKDKTEDEKDIIKKLQKDLTKDVIDTSGGLGVSRIMGKNEKNGKENAENFMTLITKLEIEQDQESEGLVQANVAANLVKNMMSGNVDTITNTIDEFLPVFDKIPELNDAQEALKKQIEAVKEYMANEGAGASSNALQSKIKSIMGESQLWMNMDHIRNNGSFALIDKKGSPHSATTPAPAPASATTTASTPTPTPTPTPKSRPRLTPTQRGNGRTNRRI